MTYMKVRSTLPDGRSAVHDTHPDHPPSATFPEGGAVAVDRADHDYYVASTPGIHDAIAKRRLVVVQGEIGEVKVLKACAREAIAALEKYGKAVPEALTAMAVGKVEEKPKKPAAEDVPKPRGNVRKLSKQGK